MRDIIPEKFYRGGNKPKAYTVGELIKKLKKLPKDLPVRQGYEGGAALVVYNISSDPFLEIADIEDEEW